MVLFPIRPHFLYLSGNANVKIRLNGDATCNGFKTQSGQSVELDLNNHVLTLAKPTVWFGWHRNEQLSIVERFYRYYEKRNTGK